MPNQPAPANTRPGWSGPRGPVRGDDDLATAATAPPQLRHSCVLGAAGRSVPKMPPARTRWAQPPTQVLVDQPVNTLPSPSTLSSGAGNKYVGQAAPASSASYFIGAQAGTRTSSQGYMHTIAARSMAAYHAGFAAADHATQLAFEHGIAGGQFRPRPCCVLVFARPRSSAARRAPVDRIHRSTSALPHFQPATCTSRLHRTAPAPVARCRFILSTFVLAHVLSSAVASFAFGSFNRKNPSPCPAPGHRKRSGGDAVRMPLASGVDRPLPHRPGPPPPPAPPRRTSLGGDLLGIGWLALCQLGQGIWLGSCGPVTNTRLEYTRHHMIFALHDLSWNRHPSDGHVLMPGGAPPPVQRPAPRPAVLQDSREVGLKR